MKKIYLKYIATIAIILFSIVSNAQVAVTVTNPTNTTPNLAASYPSSH